MVLSDADAALLRAAKDGELAMLRSALNAGGQVDCQSETVRACAFLTSCRAQELLPLCAFCDLL
jgi:hypothetical protein